MSSRSPLLFVHGFWFGSWCWSEVLGRVTGRGQVAHAVEMAGHGLRARRPRSLSMRPLDPDEVATEISPVADVDLDRAGELLVRSGGSDGGGRSRWWPTAWAGPC